jgi:hypothetical protein
LRCRAGIRWSISIGFGNQILNHLGQHVTVVPGETGELRFGWSADEELDALLVAVNEMALAVTPLFFG